MAKGYRICKTCGKEYEYCKTFAPANKFRWQDVACSPECGAKYFALVEASRSGVAEDFMPEPEVVTPVEEVVIDTPSNEEGSSRKRRRKNKNTETQSSKDSND